MRVTASVQKYRAASGEIAAVLLDHLRRNRKGHGFREHDPKATKTLTNHPHCDRQRQPAVSVNTKIPQQVEEHPLAHD